jgi:phosphoribosyl-AMP cyclohydrolase
LDRTIFNNNGEQTSIGDTIASPFNPIEKLQEDMGARQTIRAIAAAGKPELASALTLMYEEEISLNAAAKRTRVHYTTLHRQREWVKQNFALLAA